MKKRHAALAALALVGILSGCGQAETQPADNTIAIAPVEKKANTAQVDMSVKYDFSGNNADANGIEIQRYEWDGSAWSKDEFGLFTVNAEDIGKSSGIIQFDPESDAVNAEYNINVQSDDFGGSMQFADSSKLSGLPTERLTSSGRSRSTIWRSMWRFHCLCAHSARMARRFWWRLMRSLTRETARRSNTAAMQKRTP